MARLSKRSVEMEEEKKAMSLSWTLKECDHVSASVRKQSCHFVGCVLSLFGPLARPHDFCFQLRGTSDQRYSQEKARKDKG
jgi:hypothetical protein